jgi:outer membrane protein assembly factor BamD
VKNYIILSLFITTLLAGCSSPRPKGKTEAEIMYKEALQLVDDSRYILAIEKLNQIKSKFPYSYYATPSELLLADILYKQENFVEAAAAYILFRDFHPKHPKAAYVTWRIAESYFFQRPSTFDRDLTPAREAIKYYGQLSARYPSSKNLKVAKERIAICKKMLKSRQKYIADFYFKTEVYDSARFRYLDILSKFKDRALREHAMLRVVESSLHLKEKDKCLQYYKSYRGLVSSNKQGYLEDLFKRCRGE